MNVQHDAYQRRQLAVRITHGSATRGHGRRGGDTLLTALAGSSQGNVTAAAQARSFAGTLAGHQARGPRPGVLLDRDGTIIVDHGYVGSVDQVDFMDGAAEAIAKLNQADVPVALVTNQSGVARGFYSIDDVKLVHQHIAEYLHERGARIDLYLYCPFHPDGIIDAFARPSDDRKPRPGMAHAAAAALNLDLAVSWVVGDRPEDVGLAEAVGASAIYLGLDDCSRPGVWHFPSLAASVSFILERIAV
jgi:D,D-heptose 1,7-bisphosphate phosphatase